MKKLICTAIAVIGICTSLLSQERWYAAPSASMGIYGTKGGWAPGLTLGRYIGKANDLRIDIEGNWLFATEGYDLLSAAALITAESGMDIFGWDKLYCNLSLGVGVAASVGQQGVAAEKKYTDVIIPLKTAVEYRFARNFSCGIEVSYNFNVCSLKERSLYHYGVFLGFRF